jgi:hypothetical protein
MNLPRSDIQHVAAFHVIGHRSHLGWTCLLMTLLLLALSLPANAITGGANAAPHWQDRRYIENGFYNIALNGEHERISPVVRKWVEPLRVWFYSEAGDPELQQWLLSSHLQQLSEITGLPATFVDDRAQANVRILFTSESDPNGMAARELSPNGLRHLGRSVCLGQFRSNRRAEIVSGTVVIPVERAEALGKLVPCVIEEVTQMLGLLNDSRYFHPTVFSDVTDDEFLTGFDFLLLKLLYSPEVTTGMTYSQAAPVIRRQLEIWERNGLINRASSIVANSPLYALTMR